MSPVIFGSFRLTVPVSPSTLSWNPGHAKSPASVTTNDGTTKRVNTEPWKRPIAVPANTAAAIARYGDQPCCTFSTAMIEAHRPLTAPTERSISPSSSTCTIPIETRPTAHVWSTRFDRLTELMKRGSCA